MAFGSVTGVIEIVGVPYPRVLRSGDVHDCRGTGARGEGLYKDRIRCTGDRRSGVFLALHAAGHG